MYQANMLGCWKWSVTVLAGLAFTSRPALGDSNHIIPGLPDNPLDGPIIEPSESEIILQNGQNYTLKCKGKLPIAFKQQELPEVVVGPFAIQQRKVPTNDGYEIDLDLFHVDEFAVGYYACFDNSISNIDTVLNNISEEPKNTVHISYIYIYVNGSKSLMAPMREIVIPKSDTKILIECKPTSPDINVTLKSNNKSYNASKVKYTPKIGFIVTKPKGKSPPFQCEATRGNTTYKKIMRNYLAKPPAPDISGSSKYFLEGETFTLNCSVPYQTNHAVYLEWKIPRQLDVSNVKNETNDQSVTDGRQYTVIHVENASEKDAGTYTCEAKSGGNKNAATVQKIFVRTPFITLRRFINNPIMISQNKINLHTTVNSYPPVEIIVTKDGKTIVNNSKHVFQYRRDIGSADLTINNITINDTGNYTLMARNSYKTENVTYDVRPLAAPTVEFGSNIDKKFVRGKIATLTCSALGNPLPQITWHLESSKNETTNVTNSRQSDQSIFKTISNIELTVHNSLNVTCMATNKLGEKSLTKPFLVYDIEEGFGILNKESWYVEGHNVTLDCVGSIYDYNNVSWVGHTATYSRSLYSHHAKLHIENLSLENSGGYTCVGFGKNFTTNRESINITVAAIQAPAVIEPVGEQDMEVFPFQPVALFCLASAIPPPSVKWFKDGQAVYNSSNVHLKSNILNKTTVNSSIEINQALEEDKGKYECMVNSGDKNTNRFFNVMLKGKTPPLIYLSIIGVILLLLLVVVVFLAWKIRKEKQFKKMLEAAGLLHFKEGATKSLNPELGIDEQAELLPYDDKFEFPIEKIKLGKQLGAGAFGVVYKADVRGIINAEETTTVAVKMVKKTADIMFIKALASELKIMVHLGKHVNIVNLLGACTKNVGKKELVVIVEYCKFGNIHNYMQKHREVFIDQLTDKCTSKINRGFSSSSGNSGMHSDYFSSNQTQETDHTFLSNRSGRKDAQSPNKMESEKGSENGYVPPQWGSAYETDYSFDGHSPRPLCSRDLLAWAFQIARGMEYLASRKVLHGDLAARNILLAEDNIVKICDFGLARSMYKNEEYQKTENSPLPVKWLAIECLADRIFSTQSDVWSFGIVLWEMFSLAKTPYPNISHTSLLQYLSEGHRLEKPSYADERIYDVMKKCWIEKPTLRPTFTQLQETLGTFLEDNVRNVYVDLNSAYMDSNAKKEGVEDYLAMVCAPDYNNMVTPSPHHYVNDANKIFFANTPAPLLHDDEGYLQMSPAAPLFCPRAQDNKFNFDARKLNPSGLEVGSLGSERTPMLTLNNLPARSGSESDHEGNSSPYLNMCTRIDEEADNVFETKQNNIKNMYNGISISNPTYTTCDTQQNKTNDIKNQYENTNGLVK